MRRWAVLLLVGTIAGCDVSGFLASDEEQAPATAAGAVADADADRFVGDYRYAGGKKNLADAIEDLVAELNIVVRNMARDRLTETNPAFAKVSIARDGDQMSFTYDGRKGVCKLDGTVTEVEAIDGSTLQCRLSLKGDTLVQDLRGTRGGRVNTFSIRDSGKLRMKVRIHSKLMPKDMHYTLTFSR
jgi:hypothetical protein